MAHGHLGGLPPADAGGGGRIAGNGPVARACAGDPVRQLDRACAAGGGGRIRGHPVCRGIGGLFPAEQGFRPAEGYPRPAGAGRGIRAVGKRLCPRAGSIGDAGAGGHRRRRCRGRPDAVGVPADHGTDPATPGAGRGGARRRPRRAYRAHLLYLRVHRRAQGRGDFLRQHPGPDRPVSLCPRRSGVPGGGGAGLAAVEPRVWRRRQRRARVRAGRFLLHRRRPSGRRAVCAHAAEPARDIADDVRHRAGGVGHAGD
ncbi:hypothetical protein D9M72_448090 [compost metagenome]